MIRKKKEYQPLFYALFAILGLWLGKYLYQDQLLPRFNFSNTSTGKLYDVLRTIDEFYVDTVSSSEVEENAIRSVLEQLDPHSYYLTREQIKYEDEQLQGNFSGIGIEFRIINDTLTVMHPISNGPSDKFGIKAGDQIIAVNGINFTGDGINSEKTMSSLRGEIGTEVELLLLQNGVKTIKTITRREIPLPSVDTYELLHKGTGYIKISRFGSKTAQEFKAAIKKLENRELLSKLIIDVRDNPGGLMHSVIEIAELFLSKNQKIVYTKGQNESENYSASEDGPYAKLPLILLINENSASASEILAGCMQDNDRATVVGRRSFGKGLVQRSFYLNDGSSFRLTIARYYTPVGRCIQKDYSNGKEQYNAESQNRLENGELSYRDSIQVTDSLKFKTPGGKVVYGGGGIIPDVFIPIDTGLTSLKYTAEQYDLLNEYLVKNFYFWREKFKALTLEESAQILSHNLEHQLLSYFKVKGQSLAAASLPQSGFTRIKSKLLQDSFGKKGLYFLILQEDPMIKRALKN